MVTLLSSLSLSLLLLSLSLHSLSLSPCTSARTSCLARKQAPSTGSSRRGAAAEGEQSTAAAALPRRRRRAAPEDKNACDRHGLRVEGPAPGAGGRDEPGERAQGAQGAGDPGEAEPVAGCWHGFLASRGRRGRVFFFRSLRTKGIKRACLLGKPLLSLVLLLRSTLCDLLRVEPCQILSVPRGGERKGRSEKRAEEKERKQCELEELMQSIASPSLSSSEWKLLRSLPLSRAACASPLLDAGQRRTKEREREREREIDRESSRALEERQTRELDKRAKETRERRNRFDYEAKPGVKREKKKTKRSLSDLHLSTLFFINSFVFLFSRFYFCLSMLFFVVNVGKKS